MSGHWTGSFFAGGGIAKVGVAAPRDVTGWRYLLAGHVATGTNHEPISIASLAGFWTAFMLASPEFGMTLFKHAAVDADGKLAHNVQETVSLRLTLSAPLNATIMAAN